MQSSAKEKEDSEHQAVLNLVTGRVGPYKRAKFVEVKQLPSIVAAKVMTESVLVSRVILLYVWQNHLTLAD